MSTVFTAHAVERLRQSDGSPSDRVRILEILERVASNPSELAQSRDVTRVGRRPSGEDAFIVRSGDMRAIVTINPADPEQVIVITVYQADETERERLRPEELQVGHRFS